MSNARNRARQLAMQALYQWQLAGGNIRDIEAQFLQEHANKRFDRDMFRDLLHAVPAQTDKLDALITDVAGRDMNSIDLVERAILRIAVYELSERLDVPYRVVINEAIELSRDFGAEQSHRFVNGILDKLAARLRTAEVKQHKSTG